MASNCNVSNESRRKSYLKLNRPSRTTVLHSASEWKRKRKTVIDQINANDLRPFSADEATSESEFDEHPYSVLKKQKTSCQYSNRSSSKIRKEDSESSSSSSKPSVESNLTKRINCSKARTRQRVSKCESKNAVMARLNRLKKKMYIADLEERNAKLEAENKTLKEVLHRKLQDILLLKRETVNLQSVIKNSTEIGSLLQCVQKNTDLQVTSSLLSNQSNIKHLSSKGTSERPTSDVCFISNEFSSNVEGRIIDKQLLDNRPDKEICLSDTEPTSFTSQNLLNHETIDFNFDIDSPDSDFLSDLKGEAIFSEFFQDNNDVTFPTDPKVFDVEDLIRCETPSKDVNINVCNNDLPFNDVVGVCFHIANKRVSLEFCDSCNRKAAV